MDLSWTIPTPGQTVAGRYYVEAQRGAGGLAVVLSAIQIGLDRRVAIKFLLPHWASHPEVVERFLREGRAATRIKSEHVVHVIDVGRLDDGAPFLVLEYLEGNDLGEVLRQWGPLPVSTAVDWVLQAMEAIAEAHAHGIVHRDLKPANLFLTQRSDGTASIKVIDFGLSKIADSQARLDADKLTRPTDVMGSPHYMAPEQLRATCEADSRTDIWALGVVLHELIAGRPPFQASTLAELCAAVLTQPPQHISAARAGVPPAVEEAILRTLEKDPAARFAGVAELAQAIAPYGSAAARASCERIERVVGLSPRAGDVSSVPPVPPVPPPPADVPAERPFIPPEVPRGRPEPPSARIIAGSLLILTAIGAASLMGMYAAVHANDPPAVLETNPVPDEGRASMQPGAPPPGAATALAPPAIRRPPQAAPKEDLPPAGVPPSAQTAPAPHPIRPPPHKAARPRPPARDTAPASPPDDRRGADDSTLPPATPKARPTPAPAPPAPARPLPPATPTRATPAAAPPAPPTTPSPGPSDDRAFDERQ
ncbi:MAG: protein kinase [Polyangiaceae bacterium]|nr:protein kinase [Polyangiaceae bacterium]